METSYQEKILEKYHSFEAVKDCFAISRLQKGIAILSGPAAFNVGPQMAIKRHLDEVNKILAKYPDAFEPTQP